VRRLIINADDFGFTQGINRAIVEAHQAGIVTSTTLMAGGAAFAEAAALALSQTSLGVGCHVVLLGGSPLLKASEVPSLAPDGKSFRRELASFAAAALAGRLKAEEIEAEAAAQIRKLQSSGIEVTHLDTHKHVHIFPAVLRPMLRAARACGVRGIRNPFEPGQSGLLMRQFSLWRRWLGMTALRAFAGAFNRLVAQGGMISTEGILGVVATGRLNAELLRGTIEQMPEGTWEMVCHPGYDDAELRAMPTRLWESRQEELKLFLSAETRDLLHAREVQLISYRDLLQA